MNGGKSGEGEEIALMWKLRKELGDEDFAAIFEDPRITGQGPVRRKPGAPTMNDQIEVLN